MILPGDDSEYWVDPGTGPDRFPRWHAGGIELVFADLHEGGTLSVDCTLGGINRNGRFSARDSKWVEGYNVYRMADAGLRPTQAELGQVENCVYWFPIDARNDMRHTLARWRDADEIPNSGDELLLLHDSATHYDGRDRWPGTPPNLSGGVEYWYGFQPTVPGRVSDFENASVVGQAAADWRDDLDGDGLHDSVDLNGPGSADGPEFLSPQAEEGLDGLGLTTGGRALLTKVVLASAPPPPAGRRSLAQPRLRSRLLGTA